MGLLWSTDVRWMMGNAGAVKVINGVPILVFGVGVTCLHPIPESKPPFEGIVYGLHAETGEVLWTFTSDPLLDFVAAGTIADPACPRFNLPDAFSTVLIDG